MVVNVAATFKELIEITYKMICVPDPDWDEEELGPRTAFKPAK